MQEALDAYEECLSTDKQNKAVSVANTMYRLETFFSDKDMMLRDLTPRACESYYEELRKRSTRTNKAGKRALQVPEVLQPYLKGLAEGTRRRRNSSEITGGTG